MSLSNFFQNLGTWKIAVILIAIGFAVYGNSLTGVFISEDHGLITENQYIKDWKHIPKYFSENLTAGSGVESNCWRPLILISFSLDYHIGKLNPLFYHLQNLFWHILSGILIYILFSKLIKNKLAAFSMATFFLVHPLQTEAVTYISGRGYPMLTALLFLSFLFFYKFIFESKNLKSWILSIIFFVLAILVKERAIIFPFLLFLYSITLLPKKMAIPLKNKIIILSPYFIILALGIILRFTILHFTNTFDFGQENNIGADNFYQQILAYFKGLAVYAGLLFWPAELYIEKTIDIPQNFSDIYLISGLIIFIILLIGTIYSLFQKRIFAFGILWTAISIAPSLYIFSRQGVLHEHWMYLPMIGIAFALFHPISNLILRTEIRGFRIFLLLLLTTSFIALGARTIIRNNDWKNPINFYEKNISLGGSSARIYINLGMEYAKQKEYDKAIENYKKATEVNNSLFDAWFYMGDSYFESRKLDEAIEAYQKSIEQNPEFSSAYINKASAYQELENLDESSATLEKLLEIHPENKEALYNLGMIYYKKGDRERAKESLRKILVTDPENQELIKLLNSMY